MEHMSHPFLRVEPSIKDVVDSLWFACASASQTYERTLRSQERIEYHLWRIFTGKLGELTFARYLLEHNILTGEQHKEFLQNSLSIYWGKNVVDEYDLKIAGKSIDIKTLPKATHRFLIVPEDQYENENRRKDFYVGVRIISELEDEKIIAKYFNLSCIGLNSVMRFPEEIENHFSEVCLLGYAEHGNEFFIHSKVDNICPERPCYRISIEKLKPINELLSLLKQIREV